MAATVQHAVSSTQERLGDVLFTEPCAECHALPAAGLMGRDLYVAVCAMCHGSEAQGATASQLTSGLSDEQLTQGTAFGDENEGMPGFARDAGGPLGTRQVESVVEYLKALR